MRSSKKIDIQASAEVEVKSGEAITKARQLHDELLHFGVPAREVPAAIFKLRHYYHQALAHDQRNFKKHELDETCIDAAAVKVMRILLNRFTHYHLNEEDVAALQKLNFPEADHMREFLQFEKEATAYANFIYEYLVRLNAEVNKTIKDHGPNDRTITYPKFYKGRTVPVGVGKIIKILAGIERDRVPLHLFVKFDEVFDEFAAIKPSKTRPPATQEFYDKHWEEIKHFGFVPHVYARQEDDEQSDEIIPLRKSM